MESNGRVIAFGADAEQGVSRKMRSVCTVGKRALMLISDQCKCSQQPITQSGHCKAKLHYG